MKKEKKLSDLEFLEINLAMASNGDLYGNHPPMNVFSKKLLNQDWIKYLKFAGYSSSRVDFAIENAQYTKVYVYTSFKSISSGKKDKVTIRLENDGDERYACYRDNISVDVALEILEYFIKMKTIKIDNIELEEKENNVIINLKDGWYSNEQMIDCINKIKKESIKEKKNYIFNIENIEQFPWEFIDIIYNFSKEGEYKNICVCSEESLWNDYKKMFEEYYPKEKLQHYVNVENAIDEFKRKG